jgi:ketosteroid isomerase-like protein
MSDEQQIRALIEAWAIAAHDGDLESLVVTAGTEVAFAYALLRCGTATDLARDPGQRLRLTLGLRKTGGRWIVTHEHHSFPDTTGPDATPSSNVARS